MHFHGHERSYTGEADEEVCNCIQVLRCEIQEAIDEGATTVMAVGDSCGAGGGCGECHPEIALLLQRRLRPTLPDARGMSAEVGVERLLVPLAQAIGAQVRADFTDPSELVLRVDGGEDQKQTIALWAERLIDPLLGAERFLEVE